MSKTLSQELTARACADALRRNMPGCTTLAVCGGGAYNLHLMQRLQVLVAWLQGSKLGRAGAAAIASRGRGLRMAGTSNHAPANSQSAKSYGRQRRPYIGSNLPHLTPWARQGRASGRERGAATAGGRGVRVLDHKLGALQVFFVVNLGSHQDTGSSWHQSTRTHRFWSWWCRLRW